MGQLRSAQLVQLPEQLFDANPHLLALSAHLLTSSRSFCISDNAAPAPFRAASRSATAASLSERSWPTSSTARWMRSSKSDKESASGTDMVYAAFCGVVG